ncbi:MAG: hypothetical protein QME75_12090 [Deltaproteobacteria bacterium]|nr:hypothetical protein [Deltaproteobacteria bacterium]
MHVDAGDIIAGIALLLSGYATWKTSRLNNLLLKKEASEALKNKQADLGASFIKLRSSYRLKIWNKGKATARNVRLEFPEGNDVVLKADIDQKFPLESLGTFQSVELIAAVHMGTKRKHPIRLIWSDNFSEHNEKIEYPTI